MKHPKNKFTELRDKAPTWLKKLWGDLQEEWYR
jgi:hypothetical protein